MPRDPRIHVSLAHLRGLQGAARGMSFLPRQPSASVLNGRHASRLRGRGLNFEEMRDYLPGDDIRSIDWKATARHEEMISREYVVERNQNVLFLLLTLNAWLVRSRLICRNLASRKSPPEWLAT